jgi:hypothetical protein
VSPEDAKVSELDRRRAARRQKERYQSDHIVVVLPYTDGELPLALGRLEELLLSLDSDEDDADGYVLPSPFAEREATDAMGRLASQVAGMERGVHTQPVAPDGHYELGPLFFVSLAREDLARVLAVAGELAATRTRSCDPLVTMALGDYTRDGKDAQRLASDAQRLAALLRLPWDDDVDLLHVRLAVVGERVVLSASEHQAYERVTERILATWHSNDSLERFVYRGL